MSQQPQQVQSSRWCFTLNNYDDQVNYVDYFSRFDFIKRAVWGFERAPETGTRHIQGYVEFVRSFRMNVCRRVHPQARWSKAIANSLANFNYCRKGGRYETIGDWARELNPGAIINVETRPPSVPMIISALMNPATVLQTKVCKEYADKSVYYDR